MPSLAEYISDAQRAKAGAQRHLALLDAVLELAESCLVGGAEYSNAETTGHAGDTSARGTSGLTPEQAQQIAAEVNDVLADAQWPALTRGNLMPHLLSVLSRHVSSPSASGGSESPAPRSGARPVNSPGECCAATSSPGPSAPTTTITPTELSGALRTVGGNLCSALHRLEHGRLTDATGPLRASLDIIRTLLDRLPK